MRSRTPVLAAIALVALVAVLGACKKAEEPVTTPVPPPPAPAPAVPPEATREVTESFPSQEVASEPVTEPSVDEWNRRGVLRTVYFGYDQSDLTDETRAVLQANAAWLKDNAKRSIRIEGHCDERGTVEYNLALGQRRAAAAKDYLVSLGVPAERIRTVSYGKERPADPGRSEDAWARNRRAEFYVES